MLPGTWETQMEYKTTCENNIVTIKPIIREDQVLIHLGSSCQSSTAYDAYARFLEKDARTAFIRAGIEAEVISCPRRLALSNLSSHGDSAGSANQSYEMLPPLVQVIVAKGDEARARKTWEKFLAKKYFTKPALANGDRKAVTQTATCEPASTPIRPIRNVISMTKAMVNHFRTSAGIGGISRHAA
ncbi:MAG: hypothetical protein QM680_07295 [Luteolibacter sp.]